MTTDLETEPNDEVDGWLQGAGQVEDEEETTIRGKLEADTQWDTSRRSNIINFGNSFDKSGNNVLSAPPIP